jgi:hypothetical protein
MLFGWFELPIGVTAHRLRFFVPTKFDFERRNKLLRSLADYAQHNTRLV